MLSLHQLSEMLLSNRTFIFNVDNNGNCCYRSGYSSFEYTCTEYQEPLSEKSDRIYRLDYVSSMTHNGKMYNIDMTFSDHANITNNPISDKRIWYSNGYISGL